MSTLWYSRSFLKTTLAVPALGCCMSAMLPTSKRLSVWKNPPGLAGGTVAELINVNWQRQRTGKDGKEKASSSRCECTVLLENRMAYIEKRYTLGSLWIGLYSGDHCAFSL